MMMNKTLSILLCGLLACSVQAQIENKIIAADGSAADVFGTSVDISGDFAIIGAPYDDDNGLESGSAYIFQNNGSAWVQFQKIVPTDIFPDDHYGISVAIDDSVAIVGVQYDDDNGSNSGSVYIYRFDGSNWNEETQLLASDGAIDDEFGFSVDIQANRAIVGAYRNDAVASNAGAVYVFDYNGTSWAETDKLTAADGNVDDFYSYSIALDNNLIVVGAYLDDDNGVNSGGAYIYRYSGSNWSFEQKLVPSNGSGGDAFGFDVAIDNNLIAIGAYAKDNVATDDGAVYLYRYSGTWNIEDELTASDPVMDDWFGYSVGVANDLVISGAYHKDDLGTESGAFYLFGFDQSIWIEELKVEASDGEFGDQFGQALGVDGYLTISGAINDDDEGTNAGAAYIYDMCTYRPKQDLCVATVDSTNGKNLVIWKEPVTSLIDTFKVYSTGSNLLAAYQYGMTEEYTDLSSSPWAGPESYHITSINKCNAESDAMVNHATIYLEANPGSGVVNLNWTDAAGFSFPYYNIWRDSTGTGNYELIWATLASQTSYTDNNPPGTPGIWYLIEVPRGFACNPQWSATISNVSNPYTVGVVENSVFTASVVPNPANDYLLIEFDQFQKEVLIQLISTDGKVVFEQTSSNTIRTELTGLESFSGLYVISILITESGQQFTQRMVLK